MIKRHSRDRRVSIKNRLVGVLAVQVIRFKPSECKEAMKQAHVMRGQRKSKTKNAIRKRIQNTSMTEKHEEELLMN